MWYAVPNRTFPKFQMFPWCFVICSAHIQWALANLVGLAVHPKTGKKQVVAVVISMNCNQSMFNRVPSYQARPVQVLFICDHTPWLYSIQCSLDSQESHDLTSKDWHDNIQQLVIGPAVGSHLEVFHLHVEARLPLSGQPVSVFRHDFLQPVVHAFV